MVLKCKSKDGWRFYDGFDASEIFQYDGDEVTRGFDREVFAGKRIDTASYEFKETELYGEYDRSNPLPPKTAKANKVFVWITDNATEEYGVAHLCMYNAIDENVLDGASGVWAIRMRRGDTNNEIVVTNQPAYLLNDNGKTIERIC